MIRDLSQPLPQSVPAYLEWVRKQPSAASGMKGGIVAHHRIGHRYSQRKTSDFEAMSLTDAEHRQLHSCGVHSFELEWGVSEWQMIAKTLLEAIRQGVLVFDAKAAREVG